MAVLSGQQLYFPIKKQLEDFVSAFQQLSFGKTEADIILIQYVMRDIDILS